MLNWPNHSQSHQVRLGPTKVKSKGHQAYRKLCSNNSQKSEYRTISDNLSYQQMLDVIPVTCHPSRHRMIEQPNALYIDCC